MSRPAPDRARLLGAAALLTLAVLTIGLLLARRPSGTTSTVERFRGMLAPGTPWTLTPCGETARQAVVDATGGMLAQIAARDAGADPTPLYVEVVGRRAPGRTLLVTGIRYAAHETAGCRSALDDVVVRALGNEPFWAVTVTPSEIHFEAPDLAPVTFPPTAPRLQADGRVYETEGAGGGRMRLELREADCSDGMSDAYYALTASLRLDGRSFEGCAREGWR